MGRRQATTASSPGGALPADVLALHRAVHRQRRGLLRSAEQRPSGATGDRAGRREPGSDRLLPHAARSTRGGHSRAERRWLASTASGGDDCYYDVRDTRFNPLRAALQARAAEPGDVADMYTPGLAAMLIFLNRTGFNGLFRLNRQGGFNVPAGRYTNPRICDAAHLRVRGRGAGAAGRHDRAAAVRPHAGRGGRGRLRLLRSAVRAAQPDVELRELHGRRLQRVRSAAPAADGHRRLQARRVRRGVEFERAGDPATPTRRPRRRRPGSRCGACRRAGRSTRKASSRGPVDELIITNVRGRGTATASNRRWPRRGSRPNDGPPELPGHA